MIYIIPEPDVHKEVKQKLELGAVKFEVEYLEPFHLNIASTINTRLLEERCSEKTK